MGNQSSNSGKGKLFPECIVPRLSNFTGHHLFNTTDTVSVSFFPVQEPITVINALEGERLD
jgi:hypothetical protein